MCVCVYIYIYICIIPARCCVACRAEIVGCQTEPSQAICEAGGHFGA